MQSDTDTNNTDGAALLPVTQDDVTEFLNFAFRHIRLPLLDAGDIDDIRAGLENFRQVRALPATQEDAERSGADELRRLLDNVGGFLDDFARADLDEGAADAVTVGMVYQQQAQTVVLPRIRRALAALSTPQRQEYDGDAVREAIAFIDKFFEPWGAWKTVWWEGEVSGDAAFSADNALKHVANILRHAALAHPAQATPSAASESLDMAQAIEVLEQVQFMCTNHGGQWDNDAFKEATKIHALVTPLIHRYHGEDRNDPIPSALSGDAGEERLDMLERYLRRARRVIGSKPSKIADDIDAYFAALAHPAQARDEMREEPEWLSDLRAWAYPNEADNLAVAAMKKAGRVLRQMDRDKAWISNDVNETVDMLKSAIASFSSDKGEER